MGQAGRSGRAVVGGGPPLPGLAVESAPAGSASREADPVWGGRTANTVCGSDWGSLIRSRARRSKTQSYLLVHILWLGGKHGTQKCTFYIPWRKSVFINPYPRGFHRTQELKMSGFGVTKRFIDREGAR